MFTREDFLLLETMNNKELKKSIEEAKELYDDLQYHYNKLEEEKNGLSVDLMTYQLGNIENYIKKAEGLLDEEIGKVVLTTKTINKRKKLMAKLSL